LNHQQRIFAAWQAAPGITCNDFNASKCGKQTRRGTNLSPQRVRLARIRARSRRSSVSRLRQQGAVSDWRSAGSQTRGARAWQVGGRWMPVLEDQLHLLGKEGVSLHAPAPQSQRVIITQCCCSPLKHHGPNAVGHLIVGSVGIQSDEMGRKCMPARFGRRPTGPRSPRVRSAR
jgi:hypothetical protein